MADVTEGKPGKGIKREDPPPRPVEGLANRAVLAGRDPTKHYVWVGETNDPTINVGFYKSQGYQVAQYDPAEAKPTLGYQEFKQGDAIKSNGMVLMECSLEHKRALDQIGLDRVAAIEETVRNREIDPLSAAERQAFMGIKSVRTDQDDRRKWQF